MSDALYTDLLITDNDLTLDSGGEPLLVTDRACITQDIKHTVRDSGLLVLVVGQRDGNQVALLLQQLTLLVEQDVRLVPGTVAIERTATDTFFITAETYAFGPTNLQVVTSG